MEEDGARPSSQDQGALYLCCAFLKAYLVVPEISRKSSLSIYIFIYIYMLSIYVYVATNKLVNLFLGFPRWVACYDCNILVQLVAA